MPVYLCLPIPAGRPYSAHAVLAGAGQGVCLAIEDAVVLAWHLKQQGFVPEALRRCMPLPEPFPVV